MTMELPANFLGREVKGGSGRDAFSIRARKFYSHETYICISNILARTFDTFSLTFTKYFG